MAEAAYVLSLKGTRVGTVTCTAASISISISIGTAERSQ